MVQKVVEGALVFEFPDNWRVSKYDEWTYLTPMTFTLKRN